MEYESVDHSSDRRGFGNNTKKDLQENGRHWNKTRILELQKTTIIHSARILRKFLDTEPQEL